jgi:hypothetical protein
VSAYTIDDTGSFSESSYQLISGTQEGILVYNAGTLIPLQRGLLSLSLEYQYAGPGAYTTCTPPMTCTGSYAFELPDHAGGLASIVSQSVASGQSFAPLVPAESCPDLKTPQTWQFVTLPSSLDPGNGPGYSNTTWDPTQETAYGSVEISGSGSTITFNNIQQYELPSMLSYGYPLQGAAASQQNGTCAPTYYGNTTIVPASLSLTPGVDVNLPPVAVVGIGPTGLLVESSNANGAPPTVDPSGFNPDYQPLLGAGAGAIGLPQPSSALDISTLAGAQYLGFFYGGGNASFSPAAYIASFGFPATSTANCTGLPTQTSTNTVIYGGDFDNNDPIGAQTGGGFGQCDVAVDLGTQDPKNNGFYPNATVYMTSTFAGYDQSPAFPAVAIAGQLGGKYAIFVLGVDTDPTGAIPNQGWGIYLLQSD